MDTFAAIYLYLCIITCFLLTLFGGYIVDSYKETGLVYRHLLLLLILPAVLIAAIIALIIYALIYLQSMPFWNKRIFKKKENDHS